MLDQSEKASLLSIGIEYIHRTKSLIFMPNNAVAIAVAATTDVAVAVVVITNELHFYFRYYRIAPRCKPFVNGLFLYIMRQNSRVCRHCQYVNWWRNGTASHKNQTIRYIQLYRCVW